MAPSGRAIVWKDVGETPLEALERFRASEVAAGRAELAGAPMTYAGRLDPMAEGELLMLWGDECKNKERWLGLDKEYEVEVVLGVETDTYDALGLAALRRSVSPGAAARIDAPDFSRYVGKFVQKYPAYSSKTVDGKQLHELARAGELPDEMPTREVEIYSIELISRDETSAAELHARIFSMIDTVKGDFRQEEIKKRWGEVLKGNDSFPRMKIRVTCSSGTYMRSLAQRMGGFALAIRRTKIFE